MNTSGQIRHDWTLDEIRTIMDQPFNDLMFQAQSIHRQHFNPNEVQTSTLVNIKSGGCAEDCAYCSQSARNQTNLEKEQMMEVQEVIEQALVAKERGATRLCMGAAWRNPNKKDFPRVLEMVKVVKALGLETCLTLGMLNDQQVQQLKEAGLDYYNHNLDTSEAFYPKVITTRSYQDRLDTIDKVQQAVLTFVQAVLLAWANNIKTAPNCYAPSVPCECIPTPCPSTYWSPLKELLWRT